MRLVPLFAITLGLFVLTDSLRADTIAHWRLLGAEPSLETTTVRDSTENGHEGRIVGSPATRQILFPVDGRPVIFDGADDRLAIPDAPAFELTESLTIEAYICVDRYPSKSARLGHIVFRGDDRLGFDPWFLALNAKGHLRFLIANDDNEASVVLSPEPLPIGTLMHVAATLTNKNGRQSLFINRDRVATKKTEIRPAGPLRGRRPGVGIGNRYAPSNQAFAGTIHDVRISNDPLEPEQFQRSTVDVSRAEPTAEATTLRGVTFFYDVSIGELKRGASVDLGQGHHTFIDIREPLVGRRYTKRGGYEGAARFQVEKDQTLFVAFYGNDWSEGGNASGSWQHEVASTDQLKAMGWQPVGELRVQHSNPDYAEQPSWIVYSRRCRAGEMFVLRNHKYQAPLVIW